jgi:CarD family transcriptional regulator
VEFAVGDTVVYPAHGVGTVVALEDRVVNGTRQPVVMVALAEGLTVSLPLDRAVSQLRPLAGEADLGRVRETLREDAVPSDKTWLARRGELRGKLADGRLVELAELVRDSAPRQPVTAGSKAAAGTEERNLFRQAYRVLSAEIAAVRGIDTHEADRWIEEQLAHT